MTELQNLRVFMLATILQSMLRECSSEELRATSDLINEALGVDYPATITITWNYGDSFGGGFIL